MTEPILLSVDAGVARITLNRPERLNAIDSTAAYRWREVARSVVADDAVRAIVLDASGRAFCAGGDVVAMSGIGSGEGAPAEPAGRDGVGRGAAAPGGPSGAGREVARLADVIHDGHALLRGGAKPIVAAVQGAVAGGGLGFMLTADVVVASERATFAGKYAELGLTPDCGVSTLLPEAVGERRALQLLLTGTTLSAAEALDWGLVAEVVAADALAERAAAIATSWAGGAAAAYGQAKRLVVAGRHRSFRESLDDEAATIGRAFETPDAVARVAAFTARARAAAAAR